MIDQGGFVRNSLTQSNFIIQSGKRIAIKTQWPKMGQGRYPNFIIMQKIGMFVPHNWYHCCRLLRNAMILAAMVLTEFPWNISISTLEVVRFTGSSWKIQIPHLSMNWHSDMTSSILHINCTDNGMTPCHLTRRILCVQTRRSLNYMKSTQNANYAI